MASVGIVGYGSFGALLAELIHKHSPKTEVRIFSRRKKPDGKRFFAFEEVAVCDALVLAVPISAIESELRKVVPLTRPETVIVDVATVKVHTVKLLKKFAKGRAWIATHPMWGPESYKKRGGDVSGFRIVIAEHNLPKAKYAALKKTLRAMGFDVVEMSAKSHDKHLAETLFLTHFIGQIISRAGFDRTAIDTISFGYLMDAVESVRHDTQLFRDVFAFNPYCREILEKFEVSEKAVHALLAKQKGA